MIDVRPVPPEEWQILKSVRLTALADAPEAFSATLAEAQKLTDEEWQRRAVEFANGPRSITRIAYCDGVPCGMIGCHLLDTPQTSNLVSVWVSPSFRRLGVGEALIEETVCWSKTHDVTTMYAWVTDHNARAIAFYERVGFEHTDQKHPYRNDPAINEVLMARKL